jgi:hypothetical protein
MNREKELIVINKVLAVMVVVLAFAGGLLLAEREEWTKAEEKTNQVETEDKRLNLPAFDGIIVSRPKNSPLSNLLVQARYAWTAENNKDIEKADFLALVWAAQGEITQWGERTVPSYKSQFPLELGVVVNRVEQVEPGMYLFDAVNQELVPTKTLGGLSEAAMELWVRPVEETTTSLELLWHEGGSIAQNILLMTQELDLEATFVPIIDGSNVDRWMWKILIGKGKS